MVLSLTALESHLWESANILRGPVDAADFKTYIFPLLFFKRICDVWDEEYQEIVDDTGDEQLASFPESHRFQIPDYCHWVDVRAKPTNVGAALQHAMRGIEKANPDTLYGVFGADTPILVERVVTDIDEIVRLVRFPGWQGTQAGEREVKKALRKALFKYKLHADEDLFEKAYGYIRQYY